MSVYLRNVLYLFLLLILSPWLVWRSLRTGRYRQGLRDKLCGCQRLPQKPTGTTRIWLHGVSVGEIQLLGPLIERLRCQLSQVDFVVSTTTETGMELAVKQFVNHGDVQRIYFPTDLSWAVWKTIRSVNADLLVLGELEVWPNLMTLANRYGLPVAIVNGRLSARSFAGYRLLRPLTKGMFAKLSLVVAQTDEYAQRFIRCGVKEQHSVVGGSLKFDNVSFDRNCPQVQQLKSLVGLDNSHKVWVVGSSQDPEESASCTAYQNAIQSFPQLRLIIVPRHRERFDEVHKLLQQQSHSLRVLRRSTVGQPVSASDWDVLLIDTIGELRWWWGLADLALVGGSFGPRNGQNMLEPAGFGCSVAFGPRTANFRSIVELLLQADAAFQIESIEAIENWLFAELTCPEMGQVRGQRAQQLIRQHQGAIGRTVNHLIALLPMQREKANCQTKAA